MHTPGHASIVVALAVLGVVQQLCVRLRTNLVKVKSVGDGAQEADTLPV